MNGCARACMPVTFSQHINISYKIICIYSEAFKWVVAICMLPKRISNVCLEKMFSLYAVLSLLCRSLSNRSLVPHCQNLIDKLADLNPGYVWEEDVVVYHDKPPLWHQHPLPECQFRLSLVHFWSSSLLMHFCRQYLAPATTWAIHVEFLTPGLSLS